MKLALVNTTKDLECPPLTLVYVATYLKQEMGKEIQIRVVDVNFEDPLETILRIKPDVVGLSSMTRRFNYTKNLARRIKEGRNIPILIGGVHISTCQESFDKNLFDVAVIGEGEKTILELMNLFKRNNSFPYEELRKIRGILFYEDGLVKTGEREPVNLDEIPIPDRRFLNKKYFAPKVSYNRIRGERVIETGMLTSRGCPYKCTFCSTSSFWRMIRFHSARHVAAEITELQEKFGVNYIVIYDDLFAADKKRVKEVYKILLKNGVIGKVKFSCSLRANIVTGDLCKLLKKLGIVTVNFGFESGSERILKSLKGGNVNVEDNKRAVELCRKYGFDVNGSFMLGSPGETLEDMKETLQLMDYMKKLGATELWCGVTKPYPRTKLWDYAIKNKLIDKDFNWDFVDPSYVHNPIFLDKSITKKEFFKIFRDAKKRSFQTSVRGKQNELIRRLKDFVYYNKPLYDFFSKVAKKK